MQPAKCSCWAKPWLGPPEIKTIFFRPARLVSGANPGRCGWSWAIVETAKSEKRNVVKIVRIIIDMSSSDHGSIVRVHFNRELPGEIPRSRHFIESPPFSGVVGVDA